MPDKLSRTIGPDSIQAFIEDPAASTVPVKPGEIAKIRRKDNFLLKVVVTDVDTIKIRGERILYDNYFKQGKDVEVRFEDIESISVWEKQTAYTGPRNLSEAGETAFLGLFLIIMTSWWLFL
jgi:hypothetical protein